jgi:hypothetical protein
MLPKAIQIESAAYPFGAQRQTSPPLCKNQKAACIGDNGINWRASVVVGPYLGLWRRCAVILSNALSVSPSMNLSASAGFLNGNRPKLSASQLDPGGQATRISFGAVGIRSQIAGEPIRVRY